MPLKETIKRAVERVTGLGLPSRKEARSRAKKSKPVAIRFEDNGSVPNNPVLPFVHYRGAADLKGAADPAAVFEQLFEANGWGDSWRNGIYDYVHYHPRTHEVLGVARGSARVQFGGEGGKVVKLTAGDVAILPAGTGHEALSATKDLLVIGAYPPEGEYEEFGGSATEHARALGMIPKVPVPKTDPVYGRYGPLMSLWRPKKRTNGSAVRRPNRRKRRTRN